MQEKLLKLLQEINPYEEIDCNTQLMEEEILDSLTFVLFITEIENEFKIKIPETKLQPEYFESVNKIIELIESLT